MKRKCIICEKKLKNAIDGSLEHKISDPPNEAISFTSTGNYGSKLYDNININEYLEIVICDNCLHSKKDLIFEVSETTEIKYKVVPF